MTDEFRTWADAGAATFDELLASVRFEDLGKGRRGAVVVAVTDDGAVPLVRTTTQYRTPAQPFRDVHHRLAAALRPSLAFNNALVEHYTDAYATMTRHSDQALDLAADSTIAIYSCYRDPGRPARRLIVKSKEPDGAAFDIPLAHGSIVAFSLDTNRRFTHTIALAARGNEWVGITYRTSKTFVRPVDGQPCFANGARLTLATEEERREFFALRRRENAETSFAYPAIAYTISESDLLPPG